MTTYREGDPRAARSDSLSGPACPPAPQPSAGTLVALAHLATLGLTYLVVTTKPQPAPSRETDRRAEIMRTTGPCQ